MPSGREAFGPRLRAARERAGITLDAIAASTKIKRSLLVDLENGDLSQWPKGIFRRAFLRDYLAAIGAPSEAVVAEFVRLFPEEGSGAAPDVVLEPSSELRLTFADAPSAARRALGRTLAAAVDLGVVAALAFGGVAAGAPATAALAASAVVYFTGATLILGRSPGATFAIHGWRRSRRSSAEIAAAPGASAREQLHIVARGQSDAVRPAAIERDAKEEKPRRPRAVSR